MNRFLPILIFIFFAQALNGQSIIAKTAQNSVALGQVFDVSFELNGLSTQAFVPPRFKGVQIVGTSEQYASSISNGKIITKNVLVYSLKALNEGIVTIPSATAMVNDEHIVSKPLQIKVGPAVAKKNIATSSDLFLEVGVSTEDVYPGSQIVVDYVLHSKLEVTQMKLIGEDDYKTFIFHNLTEHIPAYETTINGARYESRVIRRVALYPTQAGLVKIEPLLIEVFYQSNTGGIWGQVFASLSRKSKRVKSKGIEIKTHSFPKPIPSNFSGASGKIKMTASLSDVAITTDDAVSLRIELVGSSNPTEIKAPVLELPIDLTTYPPMVIEDTIIEENGHFTFKKTFEYLLQPQAAKDFYILAKTSYFDVTDKTYKEVKTERLTLAVQSGKVVVEGGLVEEDTQFSFWLWGLLGVFFIGLVGWVLRQKAVNKNSKVNHIKQPTVIKKKNPKSKEELRKMEKVKEEVTKKRYFTLSQSSTGKPFLKEVLRETTRFFEDKLGIAPGQFNKEVAFKLIEEKGIDSIDLNALKAWWAQMESAIYANMPLPYEEAEALVVIKKIVARI